MSALRAAEAYRLWAPVYQAETAVSHLEEVTVRRTGADPKGLRLLDVGCGTGRRTRAAGARLAVGVDLTVAMIEAGRTPAGGASTPSSTSWFAAADARALPLPAASFDVVWCRLMIGHVADPRPVYAELARVCAPGGSVLVSDLHPAAAAAGHRRTFRDPAGRLHEVEHHVHPLDTHLRVTAQLGLASTGVDEGVVGPDVEAFYRRASMGGMYEEQLGLPLVLVMSFRRAAHADPG